MLDAAVLRWTITVAIGLGSQYMQENSNVLR
jgi:hypothetical protein